MFPAGKTAVLNTRAAGKSIVPGIINILGVMDEATLTTIAKNTVSKLWNGLIEFGTISAAIFGIFVILKLIKIIVDISILGAICGSVTHLLLYIKRKRDTGDQTTQSQELSTTSTKIIDQ
jgi:hypothetical protein